MKGISAKKGTKGGTSSDVPNNPPCTRGSNWSDKETTVLLDATEEVRLKLGRKDINFKQTEYLEVHKLFCERSNDYSRSQDQIYHRIKILKSQFNLLKALSCRSGWSWDHGINVLVPPSSEVLEEMIAGDPGKLRFISKPFPWFSRLLEMCGGSRARGDELNNVGFGVNIQNSGNGSSIDSPRDEGPVEGYVEFEVDQEPYPNADNDIGTSRSREQQGSDGTIPPSRSSGSNKRKSTDESEPSTRGKKIQRTLNERTEFFKSATDNSAVIASAHRDMVTIFQQHLTLAQQDLISKDADATKQCVARLNALDIQGTLRYKIMKEFSNPGTRVIWMHGEDNDVSNWINDTFPTDLNPQPVTNPPSSMNHLVQHEPPNPQPVMNPPSSMNQQAPNMMPNSTVNFADLLAQFLSSYPRPPTL